jgi:hypothetical protein
MVAEDGDAVKSIVRECGGEEEERGAGEHRALLRAARGACMRAAAPARRGAGRTQATTPCTPCRRAYRPRTLCLPHPQAARRRCLPHPGKGPGTAPAPAACRSTRRACGPGLPQRAPAPWLGA